MSTNNNIGDKTNFASQPAIPSSQKYNADEFNIIKNYQKLQGANQGIFDDANIVIDGSGTYSNKSYDQPTLSLNAAASVATSGDNIKYLKVEFLQECTVTLVGNFDAPQIHGLPIDNLYAPGVYIFTFKHDPVNSKLSFHGGVYGASASPIYTKSYSWTWSEGVDFGGTHLDFVIAGASAGEIAGVDSSQIFVGSAIQVGNYTIESTNVTNDTFRIAGVAGDQPAETAVDSWYNKQGAESGGGTAATTTYDDSGLTSGNLTADKTNVQEAEAETRAWINSPQSSLGAFDPAMTFNSQGEHNDYNLTASETWTATDIVNGQFRVFDLITAGGFIVTLGTGFNITSGDLNGLSGLSLNAGTYRVYMLSTSKGIDISVPSISGDTEIPWTIFNGSSNYIHFGTQLNNVISGVDKKFALEVEMKDYTLGALFTLDGAGAGADPDDRAFTSSYNTGAGKWAISYFDGNTTNYQGTEHVEAIPAGTFKLRIEYDGSIDTAGEDRLTLYIEDVNKTIVSTLSVGTFPFDIPAVTSQFAFGTLLAGDGTIVGAILSAEARNIKVYSGDSFSTLECYVPDLSTGIDISGNNVNGTFV